MVWLSRQLHWSAPFWIVHQLKFPSNRSYCLNLFFFLYQGNTDSSFNRLFQASGQLLRAAPFVKSSDNGGPQWNLSYPLSRQSAIDHKIIHSNNECISLFYSFHLCRGIWDPLSQVMYVFESLHFNLYEKTCFWWSRESLDVSTIICISGTCFWWFRPSLGLYTFICISGPYFWWFSLFAW